MGSVNLDNTGSGADVTLSSDGTSLLLDGTAIGGGGASLELYAENPSTPTAPSATGANAVAIGSESVSAGLRSVSLGDSYASGAESFAAIIAKNTSSYGALGSNSIAIGYRAKASGTNSFAIGANCTTTVNYGFSLGNNCLASSTNAFAIGRSTTASHNYSYAFGSDTNAYRKATMVYGGGQFSSQGDAQCGTTVLRNPTTDATATVLTSDGSTPAGVNQVVLLDNSAFAFHGTIVARQQASGGTACAAWKVEGLIRREGSAGTTTLVNSATTVLDNTPSWGMALSADTTIGALAITVTGAAATNIRWVATIYTSEVTYA